MDVVDAEHARQHRQRLLGGERHARRGEEAAADVEPHPIAGVPATPMEMESLSKSENWVASGFFFRLPSLRRRVRRPERLALRHPQHVAVPENPRKKNIQRLIDGVVQVGEFRR